MGLVSALVAHADEGLLVQTGEGQRSTHGLVRVAVATDGERIETAGPALGCVHRGLEKLAEQHAYEEIPVLLDRCDHLAACHAETMFAMSLERLAGVGVPDKARWTRTLLMETGRLASHLVWLASWARDAGLERVAEHAARRQAIVMDLMRTLSGRRTVFGYIRPGGVVSDLPAGARSSAVEVLGETESHVDRLEGLLARSGVFARLAGLGAGMDAASAVAHGVTGPNLRACGRADDVRRTRAYEAYPHVEVGVPIGEAGDCRDRCLVRLEEMRWSARVALQVLEGMPEGAHAARFPGGLRLPAGEVHSAVESPRGELGMHLVCDGSPRPYRLRLRTPSFFNLGAATAALVGVPLDVAGTVLGTFDLIAGEIER